ncbi:MAG: DUF2219 domain-containing protein [Micavibrio aeruginosavorus]|uniref:DUF2219 domain-containing protein n=1 Tax=Micavibrio aeruginosavorus TaxID=349221 RepID=A0A2W5MQ25_9BACT|nr:MAG: DUF2219 domain-containing protein [Micavibrio aeruginosavorus]
MFGLYSFRHLKALALPVLLTGSFLYTCPAQAQTDAPADPGKIEREAIQNVRSNDKKNYLSFSYENDLIGSGRDQYYTNGVRMTYFNVDTDVPPVIDRLADAIPTFDINDTTSTFFTLGQNLYTPSEIDQRNPDPDDRPYAAWLYGSLGLATLTQDHIDSVELTLGIVGPSALGEQTQKFIHTHVTDSPTPKGWSHQLDDEPGVVLSWERRWPGGPNGNWQLDLGDDFRVRAQPNVNVSLGNIYTYAGTGMMFTLGPYQDTLQDTPPRVQPAMSGTGYFNVPDQEWSWYVFSGFSGRAVARNIFLDGNTWEDSPSVDKKILVGDAVAGLALTLYDYRLSYTVNYRTKEFDGQDDDTIFGSITLTSRF